MALHIWPDKYRPDFSSTELWCGDLWKERPYVYYSLNGIISWCFKSICGFMHICIIASFAGCLRLSNKGHRQRELGMKLVRVEISYLSYPLRQRPSRKASLMEVLSKAFTEFLMHLSIAFFFYDVPENTFRLGAIPCQATRRCSNVSFIDGQE